ncbi:MAG: transglutaminase domain-containing protein [Acetatifactor sp.]
MTKYRKIFSLTAYLLTVVLLAGCGLNGESGPGSNLPGRDSPGNVSSTIGTRDSTPVCLVPRADGTQTTQNDLAVIDYSNSNLGYICASYTGAVSKVKLIMIGPDNVKYTYDLHGNGYEVFPISSGSGSYQVGIYENVSGTNYSTCLFSEFDVTLDNEFGPFLYPNQYVNFNADSMTVAKGAELAKSSNTDLDVVINIYNYIISSITYDEAKASDPPTGYTTDVDAILSSGTGICLDYAAVMAAMLRSQQIPTRLEVGYAKDAYHAWISVYTVETGWLNGLIEFTGNTWTLVDPTFGANSSEKALKKFIGDGSNYVLQKVY